MESKNIQKAAMIGHSMGGIAMMILALRAVCIFIFHNIFKFVIIIIIIYIM